MHLRLHPVVSAKGFIKRIYQVISLYLMYMTRTISTLDSPQDCFCFISESFQDYKSLAVCLGFSSPSRKFSLILKTRCNKLYFGKLGITSYGQNLVANEIYALQNLSLMQSTRNYIPKFIITKRFYGLNKL